METALKLAYSAPVEKQKTYVNDHMRLEPKVGVRFTDFIEGTLNRRSRRMSENSKKNYRSLAKLIEKFSNENNAKILTDSVNAEFLEDFIIFLEEQDYKMGYIKNILSMAKTMARKAGNYGYAVDPSFEEISYSEEESQAIFLSMNEIARIYYSEGLTRKQERIKDLFIIGCLTALRYSDYSTLTKSNFIDDYIVKVTKKTKKKVIVPMHDFVKEIIKKYDGVVSPNISIQHFNRYIKMICKEIGLTDEVVRTCTRGGKLVTETKQKWELVKSHTARRSAATNMYLTGRMKTFEIMALTGHTTEKAFFRYIRVTSQDIAKQISGDIYFRK